jgi:hypothetical protein
MDLFGIDMVVVLLTAGFVTFWGVILLLFVIFYDINPYMPRKYYTVKLENKDGEPLRACKGWIVTKGKVKWFRIGLKGFPAFKGVEKDIAVLETINKKGEVEIIEDIPDKYEDTNYTPKNIPITQKEAFIRDVASNISEENRGVFELKLRETIAAYSRVVDLNTSKATKEYISQARREAERVKGDDFIYKYGPILSLIVACLFAYLIIDGSVKSYQTTMQQQNSVMENGYKQVITQCGGVYSPMNPVNTTTAPPQSGVKIPFVNS